MSPMYSALPATCVGPESWAFGAWSGDCWAGLAKSSLFMGERPPHLPAGTLARGGRGDAAAAHRGTSPLWREDGPVGPGEGASSTCPSRRSPFQPLGLAG